MLTTPIGRVRAAGLLEGVSFLVLLFIAMPLKYGAGLPEPVFYVGSAHGGLFILYCVAILAATLQRHLPIPLALLAFLAAIVPFGPFLVDGRLKREEARGVA